MNEKKRKKRSAKANGLGERLAFARGLSGLSAGALDFVAGRTTGHAGNIEAGRRLRVGGDILSSYARALGVTIDWLQDGVGEAPTLESVQAAIVPAIAMAEEREAAKAAQQKAA